MSTRVMVKWFTFEDTYSDMVGIVEIYDTTKNEFLGEWKVEVKPNNVCHKALIDGNRLPSICSNEDVMHMVEEIIDNYMDGFRRNETTHRWLTERPTFKKRGIS